ncbi:hypothetical protein M8C21_032626 [Ambrosia artemisiifolia]|uniref:Uncharacterized protein n=1 Tax=Ambrosia artemisiifolia TaxID=4212 RepID=A0AAD5D1L0_AMBAR|nr:hypothetical protein M8C21_032626 [Ambrosia artemisiifolia]
MFRVCGREFTELLIVATSQPNQGKVWDTGKKALRLSQEICEHAKAIVCLHAKAFTQLYVPLKGIKIDLRGLLDLHNTGLRSLMKT